MHLVSDGNLVVLDSKKTVLLKSGASECANYFLLQDDGDMLMFDSDSLQNKVAS